jgi:ectoine hydroxylase-related dioxygenase (phytanoyl-CoA dioxygenase family)
LTAGTDPRDRAQMTDGELKLHPRNSAFRWISRPGPYEVLTDDEVAAFDRDGFVVLHDVIDPQLIAEVRSEIDAFEAETERALRAAHDERMFIAEAGAITFSVHLVTRSPLLRSFAAHPVFTGLCHDLVGDDVRLYWDQAVYKKPEKPRRFPWHQDNGYAFVEPQQYLTCWVPLVDATVDNGCPQVAAGLHRLGTLQHHYVDPLGWECLSDPDDVRVAEVAVGGVVVFSSLTPHLTGPNTTDHVRKAYILQYAPDGAEVVGDTGRTRCDDPARQFPILHDGHRVER